MDNCTKMVWFPNICMFCKKAVEEEEMLVETSDANNIPTNVSFHNLWKNNNACFD